MEHLYVFLGMAGMMMLYMAMLYYQLRSPIYAYYSIYILCWFSYFFVRLLPDLPAEWYEFFRVSIPMTSYIMYYQFSILFVDLKRRQPVVYKLFNYTCFAIPFYIALDALLCFGFDSYIIHEQIHTVARVYIIVVSTYGIIKTAKNLDKLFYYILVGSAFVIVGNTISMVLTFLDILDISKFDENNFFMFPIFYMQLGIILELLCFSLGLGHRQRLIEQEKIVAEESLEQERKQHHIEKLEAVVNTQKQERIRVAAELHDDIGSGLTSIRFLSEKILAKMPDSPDLKKVSERSKELVANMSEIVWMMSDNHIMLEDLVIHIKKYAFKYLEENSIALSFHCPEELPELELTNEQRRNIFLSVKECLHNIVKHAQANSVAIDIRLEQFLYISINDNGIGISDDIKSNGNGLKNMRKRMQSIQSEIEISNQAGLKIEFIIKLNNIIIKKTEEQTA